MPRAALRHDWTREEVRTVYNTRLVDILFEAQSILDKPPHRYTFTEAEYVADVRRFAAEVGQPEWVAPMDWMCEPFMLAKTTGNYNERTRRRLWEK